MITVAYIYKLTNTESGKVYIGQTTQDPARRWRSSTGNTHGYRGTTPIAKAITSKGWEVFTKEILETLNNVTQSEIDVKEAFYIDQYDSLNRDKGYNCKSFAEGGKEFYTDIITIEPHNFSDKRNYHISGKVNTPFTGKFYRYEQGRKVELFEQVNTINEFYKATDILKTVHLMLS